ncbi:MAG: T9SS type A sorting domain-containing protein [Ignavibacteria bacterium]
MVNEEKTPGRYKAEFNGSKLASGIYFYRITATDFSETKKMIMIK